MRPESNSQRGAADCETLVDTQFPFYGADEASEAFETFVDERTCKPVFDISELR